MHQHLVALLFCADMRRSEVADLIWQDVEPTARPGVGISYVPPAERGGREVTEDARTPLPR